MLPVKELTARAGMPHFFEKVRAGKTVRVAFLGGSITRAHGGYRDQLMIWLKETYPAAEFEEIMAAVSGTGSDFGACRVRQHVIEHQPDLVLVEFAVNDNRMLMQYVRETVEGIVRQVYKANASTDIGFIYTFSNENIPALQEGLFPPSVSAMEAIADHYKIPSIHMGLQVLEQIDAGKMIMIGKRGATEAVPVFSYDGVHPLAETGHKIYTQVLARNFLTLQQMPGNTKRRQLPAALEKKNWEDAGMIGFKKKAHFTGDWSATDSVTKGKEFYSLLPTVQSTASKDACLTVKFKGTRFGLADIMGPSTGVIEIIIDDQPPRTVARFDAYCTYYRLNYFLLKDLPPGKHTARIRLSDQPLDKEAILKTRNNVVKDWQPYEQRVMYVGAILY